MSYNFVKRLFDLIFAALLLAVCSPLILVIAALISMEHKGPVFYRAVRSGLFGVPFKIWKFRTMVVGADKGSGTTALNDPRITKLGSFLRASKLDELPQLFNVLVGEMSFVGPRPQLPEYTARYIGDEKLILSVKPGITDFSSVEFADLQAAVGSTDAGKVYDEVVLPRQMELRLRYVRERSFALDLYLIAKTAWVLCAKMLGFGNTNTSKLGVWKKFS